MAFRITFSDCVFLLPCPSFLLNVLSPLKCLLVTGYWLSCVAFCFPYKKCIVTNIPKPVSFLSLIISISINSNTNTNDIMSIITETGIYHQIMKETLFTVCNPPHGMLSGRKLRCTQLLIHFYKIFNAICDICDLFHKVFFYVVNKSPWFDSS